MLQIAEENGRPIVERGILRCRRQGNKRNPFHFIDRERGEGGSVEDTSASFDTGVSYEDLKREAVSLDSPDILAIKALGQFRRFEAASQFRELIEGWTVSDFRIDDARIEPDAAPAEHLNEKGDNLALYAQHLHQNHPEVFESLLREMPRRVPGIAKIGPEETEDGRVVLRCEDPAVKSGFIARAVSDGTIKMFAYLALLADPHPHPLLCIEEPENQLYPTLLSILAEEFAEYASRRSSGAQVFVTTHSPDFLSAVPINSGYWLEKRDGYASIRRAANDAELCKMAKKGQKLGWLWRQGWFKGADP